tara:strand:- start:1729 stop:1935 length:207 start_codon:yes stop_codon:yes gene_type:complete
MICKHCFSNEYRCQWQSNERFRHIRVSCADCGRWIKFAPQVEQFVDMANSNKEYTENETKAIPKQVAE